MVHPDPRGAGRSIGRSDEYPRRRTVITLVSNRRRVSKRAKPRSTTMASISGPYGIRLSADHQRVIRHGADGAEDGRISCRGHEVLGRASSDSGANVTGLGTLISGAYIGLEIGDSKEDKRDFVGLETPPVITGEVPGRLFVLKTPTWVRWTTAHRSSSGGCRSARSRRTPSTRTASRDREGVRARPLRPVRQPQHALLACERNRRLALGERSEGADPVDVVDHDRRYRVRDRRGLSGPPSGRREYSLYVVYDRAMPSSQPRAIRRPIGSSSTNRCAG